MKAFVSALEKELAGRLRKIESSDLSILKKSLEASLVLGDAFQRLREFVSSYTFESEAEEIEFPTDEYVGVLLARHALPAREEMVERTCFTVVLCHARCTGVHLSYPHARCSPSGCGSIAILGASSLGCPTCHHSRFCYRVPALDDTQQSLRAQRKPIPR